MQQQWHSIPHAPIPDVYQLSLPSLSPMLGGVGIHMKSIIQKISSSLPSQREKAKGKKLRTKTPGGLAHRAEQSLRAGAAASLPSAPSDIPRLIHELRVHQIELALQNEELRKALLHLEQSRARYMELYDHAPVGYFTFDSKGRILAVNLTGSRQFGQERDALLQRPFSSFMSQTDADLFYLHLKKVFAAGTKQSCALTLFHENREPFFAQLDSISSLKIAGDGPLCQTTITDISVCKELEETLIRSNIREITTPTPVAVVSAKAPNGTERRVKERRCGLRQINEQLKQEIREHQRIEADLVKALAEINTLKDRLVLENIYFHQETKKKHQFENIIGQSDGLKYVLYRVEQVAPTDTTVLILGETGTGKELIAAAIHNLSPRKDRPLITVNCAAMPANLLEAELFGREKGAYTGAVTRQIGRFEIANGSTLCLDEIGEMPLEMQAKLLRVLQHSEFERLGSSKTIKVDVRIVATTNRNLEEAIRASRFRLDLFYRLNVFPLTVPPLRQRKDDIPLLVQAFVERYARKLGKRITSISEETMNALMDYSWPGNIRELESIIERAIILCPGPGFQLADQLTPEPPAMSSEKGTLKEVEQRQIMKALSETKGRIEGKKGAAMILGIHPSTLRARMHKLAIRRPAESKPSV